METTLPAREPMLVVKEAGKRITQYIGLGDSISIDDYPGAGLGAISLLYRNRNDLYPEFRGRDLCSLNPETRLFCLAYDGATTEGVLEDQLRQLPPPSEGLTLVTLTVGGNDLLACLSQRGCIEESDVADVVSRLERIVEELLTTYPRSLILVGTIYDPTDGVGDLWIPGQPDTEALHALHATNERIRTFDQWERVYVADLHLHFLGHGLHHRDPSNPYYDPVDPTCWYTLTIEPNPRGASEVRRVFWETLMRSLPAEKALPL